MCSYNYKIDIDIESLIFEYILQYTATFDNIKTYNTSRVKFNPLENSKDKKYIVELRISHGIYEINYNDDIINIEYTIDDSKPVGLAHMVKCNEKLLLYSNKSIKHLEDFIKQAFLFRRKDNNNEIEIKIFKNHWTRLNKLPKRKLDTIYLYNKIKKDIIEDINEFLENEEEYEIFGMPYKKTYLLEGLPGTGKTSLIFAIASLLKMDIAIIGFGPDIDDAAFMKAVSYLPDNAILLIEDIDNIFSNEHDTKINTMISLSGILNTLDGVARRHRLITFITTNHFEKLDNTLTRPGRTDKIIHFTYATKEQINLMYNKFRNEMLFDEFYNKIKHKNYTTATLQKFFFLNRKNEKIIDCIDSLFDINNEHDIKENVSKISMYC